MTGKRIIPRLQVVRVWWRLFFLQASWNFENMQGVGLGYALLPGLKRLYSGKKLADKVRQYLAYYNTHPYMTTFIAGAVLRLEEKQASGEAQPIQSRPFIEMVIAPFAAMGDALFWGGLRPLASVVAVFVAVFGSLWASGVFLLLFAMPRLVMSIVGFALAYRQEIAIVNTIRRLRLADCAVACKRLLMLGLGALAAYSGQQLAVISHINPLWGLAGLVWLVFVVSLLRRGVPLLALVWGTLGLYWVLQVGI